MLVLLFIPYLKGNVKKGFLWWVLGVFALLEGMIFVTLCTVGQYAVTQSYPLYAVAKMARLFYFQRMDAVHMVIWTMIGLIKSALYLFIAQRCLCFLFGAKRKNTILLALGGITILCSLLLAHYFTAYQALYNFTLTGIPLYVAVLLVPVLLILGLYLRSAASHAGGSAKGAKLPIPWFAVGFLVLAIINSLNIIPADVVAAIRRLDVFALTMAMTALGIETRFANIRKAGPRVMALGLILYVWLLVGGYGIVKLAS